MTAAWFLGSTQGVAQDETTVRETMDPIRTDPELAEEIAPPDFNEFSSDDSGQLTGLSKREVADDVTETVKAVPTNIGLATVNHNAVIDNQVASSGTAASREMAGQSGHGSMQYATALSPEIRDGAAFGNDYFAAMQAPIQEGAGQYMSAVDTDAWSQQVSQAFANENSRVAYQSSMYSSFLKGA